MADPEKSAGLTAIAEIGGVTVVIDPDRPVDAPQDVTLLQPDPKHAEKLATLDRQVATEALTPYAAVTGIRL